MQLNSRDLVLIEQALREAMNQGADYHRMVQYREVLTKLQSLPAEDEWTSYENVSSVREGFRYDYDDASDLS